jgi:light-regulated signal transduction histidine kinase (bacteriophytochrome)
MQPLRPDLTACADEPIRVPGAIQPHGRMLVFDESSGALLARSANWPPQDDPGAILRTLDAPPAAWPADESPAPAGTVELAGGRFDASVHRRGGCAIVEFEPAAAGGGARSAISHLARHVMPALQAARTVEDLCALAARELKRLTGFGRCLAYRFDAEGHGQVLSQALDEGYASYAGHYFPASDIPAQARALYCLNYVRVIPDADYDPVPLLAAGADPRAEAIDLSLASLRSVSPVHLEYMRNMGMRASMSISVVVRGRLWGLVSGHDRDPRQLDFETRAACEHLGRLLSMCVAAAEEHAEVAQRLELRHLTLELIAQRPDLDASLMGLLDAPDAMLGLARAGGAAVVLNESCRLVGETPEAEDVVALARRIAARGEDCFSTDRLVEVWPEAEGWGERCAGVLALSISQVHRHLILWFRPAVARTIRWAGEPNKELRADGRIHPRRSFDSWQQELRDRSLPWHAAERAAALELRQSLIAIVLRRAEELADLAGELGRANKELEAFSYTVSHDLRAPMRHISGYVDLVLDLDAAVLSDRARRYLTHVKDASAYSGQLVDGLLDFSRMGRAAIKRGRVDTRVLVADLVREFGRLQPGRAIEWEVAADLPVLHADPLLMQVALRNLVGNAVKYTRDAAPARVRIRAVRRGRDEGLEVEDNGVGFDMKYVGKLFGVFQRLHQSDEFEGTGIGLASIRRIVERHGGQVWAVGELGRGATFGFTLPRDPEN